MLFHSWITLASTFVMGGFFLPSVLNATAPVSSLCCTILNSALPTKTSFPGDDTREMEPACRVAPESADDVSLIVRVATENRCTFAVKSGGHMSWGGSNVGPAGFTIDLGSLNTVSVHEDEGIVSFGSGCVWREVYEALAPYNLTTVGGRVSNVGVGGFLGGGGISFLSIEHGLGSVSVVNYLVVLADGAISNVNEASLPDLYWALKYGSTNFGIVVRFDMITYPVGLMWGGSLYLPVSDAPPILHFLVDLLPNLAQDPKGMAAILMGWDTHTQDHYIWVVVNYREPTMFPPLFAPLQSFKPLQSTLRLTDLLNITDELKDTSPDGSRARWISLTLVPDAPMLLDLFNKGTDPIH
ncbi:hypothetical protein B0H10DRAFT_2098354, partial [Mycena sp. CBHHK59/15]